MTNAGDGTQPQLLYPAPAARSRSRYGWVLAAGTITTIIALGGQWALDRYEQTNIMGWYADGFIPGGAILIGVVASLGFAVGSWVAGVRPRGWFLFTIFMMLLGAYFLLQYASFVMMGPLVSKTTGARLGFWQYYHLVTMNLTWESETPGGATQHGWKLQEAGYLVRFAEIMCVAGLGTLIPLLVRLGAYCDVCERYMKTRSLAVVPLTVVDPAILKDVFDVDRGEKGRKRMAEMGVTAELKQLAEAGKLEEFQAKLGSVVVTDKKEKKQTPRLEFRVVHCTQCWNGRLDLGVVQKVQRSNATTWVYKQEAPREFVRGLVMEGSAEVAGDGGDARNT